GAVTWQSEIGFYRQTIPRLVVIPFDWRHKIRREVLVAVCHRVQLRRIALAKVVGAGVSAALSVQHISLHVFRERDNPVACLRQGFINTGLQPVQIWIEEGIYPGPPISDTNDIPR